ncbi:MAG: aspartyl protease family protein [Armatimonadota bacterium]|nr:aspartyl protease family protein [Armatimonadota bacterium]MDR7448412.1 aspartyl protease family protein [Armatimonadota bacterium]MDR7459577.1 aspartyl protease family protein [Armatimonadota bacterium]MDR7480336.1 aspartyl protease family protein [Armatimonadota bacterium]MDR7488317.1 aspartyl protease family protein [Armatimonadota bacterium]
MGTFRVTLELGDPQGHRWEALDAVVDTGASYTWAPRDVLQRLGVTPQFRREFVTADGRGPALQVLPGAPPPRS